MSATLRQTILAGIILGIVAGFLVWYLERFEVNRIHGEFRRGFPALQKYLAHQAEFDQWLAEHGD